MKTFTISLLCVVIATLHANAQEVQKYELFVDDFTELKVVEGINVDYKCSADSAGYAVFEATADMASVLMFSNNKNCLEMQISTDGIDYTSLPRVTVYSRFLNKVENSGDSLVRVVSLSPTASLRARLIGNGRLVVRDIDVNTLDASIGTGNGIIVLYGSATSAKLSIVGTGSIQADDFSADKIKCSLLGTGSIGCNPLSELNISGASSGKIYYKGSPKIKNRSLGVKAYPIDDQQ